MFQGSYDSVDRFLKQLVAWLLTLASAQDRKDLRILLIDDNRHGLAARRTILEGIGYRVTLAESGEEGLAHFEFRSDSEPRETPFDLPFDLVVTDYRMPGVWGDEVVRRVKHLSPDLPVIILSGYTLPLALSPGILSRGPAVATRERHTRRGRSLCNKTPTESPTGGRVERTDPGCITGLCRRAKSSESSRARRRRLTPIICQPVQGKVETTSNRFRDTEGQRNAGDLGAGGN